MVNFHTVYIHRIVDVYILNIALVKLYKLWPETNFVCIVKEKRREYIVHTSQTTVRYKYHHNLPSWLIWVFFWVRTLTKFLSVCKISSKNDICRSRGKKNQHSKMLSKITLLKHQFVLATTSKNVILWWNFVSTENFCWCFTPKFQIILKCFSFILDFTAHSELEWAQEQNITCAQTLWWG